MKKQFKSELPEEFQDGIYYLVKNNKNQPLYNEENGQLKVYLTEKLAGEHIIRERKKYPNKKRIIVKIKFDMIGAYIE